MGGRRPVRRRRRRLSRSGDAISDRGQNWTTVSEHNAVSARDDRTNDQSCPLKARTVLRVFGPLPDSVETVKQSIVFEGVVVRAANAAGVTPHRGIEQPTPAAMALLRLVVSERGVDEYGCRH